MALRPPVMEVKTFLSDDPAELARSRRALTWLMNGLVQVNKEYIQTYPDTPRLYDSGVKYQAEVDTENWQDIPRTLELGYGDCEDLACYRAGELQARGIHAMPYVTWRQAPQGGIIYHALVRWPNGLIEDPSRALGMTGYFTHAPVIIGYDGTGLTPKAQQAMQAAVKYLRANATPRTSEDVMGGWHLKLPKDFTKIVSTIATGIAVVYPPAAPFVAAGIAILKAADKGDVKALAKIAEVKAAAELAPPGSPEADKLKILQASQIIVNDTANKVAALSGIAPTHNPDPHGLLNGQHDMMGFSFKKFAKVAALSMIPGVGPVLAYKELRKKNVPPKKAAAAIKPLQRLQAAKMRAAQSQQARNSVNEPQYYAQARDSVNEPQYDDSQDYQDDSQSSYNEPAPIPSYEEQEAQDDYNTSQGY